MKILCISTYCENLIHPYRHLKTPDAKTKYHNILFIRSFIKYFVVAIWYQKFNGFQVTLFTPIIMYFNELASEILKIEMISDVGWFIQLQFKARPMQESIKNINA